MRNLENSLYPNKIEMLLDDCYEWTMRPWAEVFDVVGESVDSQFSDEIHDVCKIFANDPLTSN